MPQVPGCTLSDSVFDIYLLTDCSIILASPVNEQIHGLINDLADFLHMPQLSNWRRDGEGVITIV